MAHWHCMSLSHASASDLSTSLPPRCHPDPGHRRLLPRRLTSRPTATGGSLQRKKRTSHNAQPCQFQEPQFLPLVHLLPVDHRLMLRVSKIPRQIKYLN
ncbi:hypothetical protein ACP4OV_003515 [Aristida adscensionis]